MGLSSSANTGVFNDALTGLLNLGYDNQSAGEVLSEVLQKDPDLTVGEALRAALKTMVKKK
jgi:Holliday junction DNA helicase RuvA